MMNEINVTELLNNAYIKMFNGVMVRRYQVMTMKTSDLKFRVYEGYGDANYKWELQFEKSIDFGYGNYKSFTFKTDLELGKFLFECGSNNGLPSGAKGILN